MKVYISDYPKHRWYHNLLRIQPSEKTEFVQIEDHDIWSLDVTLSAIIAPSLRRLKDLPGGASAFVEINDRPGHLIGNFTDKGSIDEHYHEAWDWAVNEMIYAFESCKNQFSGESEEDYLENDLRIENGLRLFGKYYRGLWH